MSATDLKEFDHNGDYDTWKKFVLKELGDKPYESLIWKNENGFDIEPNYTEITHIADVKRPVEWEICQESQEDNPAALNKQLLASLMGGCNAIGINRDIVSEQDLATALQEVQWPFISVHFRTSSNPLQLINAIIVLAEKNNWDTHALKGSISLNGLSLSSHDLAAVAAVWKKHFTLFRIFEVDASTVHAHGGNTKQELAYALASGNELLHRLNKVGVAIDDAAAMIQICMSTSGVYFLEIAKFRSLRLMWRTLVEEYQPQHACSSEVFIYAHTSSFLQTSKDMNNNLLRSVTQAMSAILGTANAVHILPHNSSGSGSNDTSRRLARNIQQLLIEESYLDKMGDIAAGSHYIEKLTELITHQSWQYFQEIEVAGGIAEYQPVFDEAVKASLEVQKQQILSGSRIVVGVNKYSNKADFPVHVNPATLTGFMERE
jgi:methylmalonyl-CoA mutase